MKKTLLFLLLSMLSFGSYSQVLNWRFYDSVQVWVKFNIRNLPEGQSIDSLLSRNAKYNTQRISPLQLPISRAAQTALDLKYNASNPSGFINLSQSRAGITVTNNGSGAATYNQFTGELNIPLYLPAVSSVFGRTGAIVAASGDYNTSQITEGSNLYYTVSRFNSAFATKTTTDLSEGINLYWTQGRFNASFSGKTTGDLSEGSNLYFNNARARSAISAATGISYNSTTGIFSLTKRQEPYTGTTNASGIYTVAYATPYSTQPIVVPSIVTTDPRDVAMVTASSTTGFTVQVQRRVDVVGLLPTYTNRSGIRVDAFIIEP